MWALADGAATCIWLTAQTVSQLGLFPFLKARLDSGEVRLVFAFREFVWRGRESRNRPGRHHDS